VNYHNVVGHDPDAGWREYLVGDGDGVVSLASARLDEMRQLRSQVIVPADHITVHRHPQTILEVRRILLDQLSELSEFPYRPVAETGDYSKAGNSLLASPSPAVSEAVPR
jgi:hypothetical protein